MLNLSRGINWGPILFIGIYHILLLFILPIYLFYSPPSLSVWVATLVLLYLTGLSITAGYHRFFSHRSYKTHPIVETILLFFGSMSAQGSALRWSYDHRIHHAHVDTDDDPYCIEKGFMYAHCLWIIETPRKIEKKVVSDLLQKPLVVLQDRYYKTLLVGTNFIAWAFTGWLLSDYLGAFILTLWLRLFLLHHFTWFINSLAHTWGSKYYSQEHSAVDNYIISLLTFGEGYHNYHHTYANDYRNGIKWYNFDPTKWLIWTLSKLGLAHGLRKMDSASIRKRLIQEDEIQMLDKLTALWYVKKDELEAYVKRLSSQLNAHYNRQKELMTEYRNTKGDKAALHKIKQELKELKQAINEDWKMWKALNEQISQFNLLTP